ncbi:MAG: helix-turn-helix transcriptional regulator [Thermodesulfobacteriota bacterium]
MDQTKRTQKAAKYIKNLLNTAALPRNQVAALSGLSNGYILHLENGQIANVNRKKLIAFAVSLSLDLFEIDRMLTLFDRAKLDEDDIPLFIERVGNRRLSSALLPLHTSFSYELFILNEEKVPGKLVIVNDRPTANTLPPGYRTYFNKNTINHHPIFLKLIESIGRARRDNFLNLLENFQVEHYICRDCFFDYMDKYQSGDERLWRQKHLQLMTEDMKNHSNLKIFITDYCPKFNFTIKIPDNLNENSEKLFFLGNSPHSEILDERIQILGFGTENKTIVQNFKKTLTLTQGSVVENIRSNHRLKKFIKSLTGIPHSFLQT